VNPTFRTDSYSRSIPNEAADADEIVGSARYLATDESSYLTGQMIVLDGGGS